MLIKSILEKLEKRDEFLSWKKGHTDAFLAHVMVLIEEGVDHQYDIGYYDGEKMATFLVDKDVTSVEVKADQEVFKDPEHEILKLNKDKIHFGYEDALKKAAEIQKEKYPTHIPMKEVVLLQHIKEGSVWNITYMTKTFKTLNIKIDSDNGKVISDKLVELFSFG